MTEGRIMHNLERIAMPAGQTTSPSGQATYSGEKIPAAFVGDTLRGEKILASFVGATQRGRWVRRALLRGPLTLCIVLAALAHPDASAQRIAIDRIAVVVNNEAITDLEIRTRMMLARTSLEQRGIAVPDDAILRRQVLEQMILERAGTQMAREMNLRVDETAIDRALDQIAAQNRMNREELLRRARAEGRDLKLFREGLRAELLMQRLREREVDSRIQVSEADVDAALASLGASANVEYRLAQILIRLPETASPEQVERARVRLEDLRSQAGDEGSFARLAAAYSEATEASAGGEIGWRSAERLPTLFVREIERLKPGEMSRIVRSPAGFHLLRLGDRREASASAGPPVIQWRARHILLRVSEVLPEPEALRRAQAIAERIRAGEDFAALARAFSADGTAARGGELGWLLPGDTVPDFEQALRMLPVNELSPPVRSPFGIHLIQVLERRTEAAPVERQRTLIRQALRERKAEEAYDSWLQELRDRAYVEYRLDSN